MNSELDGKKLKEILGELSIKRPVFESEDDFKFSLAWKIKEEYKNKIDIRLEKKVMLENENKTKEEKNQSKKDEKDEKNQRIDIFIYPWKIGIELKYFTAEFEYSDTKNGEKIKLAHQAAENLKSYDAWKDVKRLEEFVDKDFIKKGFSIWLTNMETLYKKEEDHKMKKNKPGYYDFRIWDGREIKPDKDKKHSNLKWIGKKSKSIKKRRGPITIKGIYKVKWEIYYESSEKNGKFKYSLLEVLPLGEGK
jgi:hypothetical protein